MNIFLKNGHVNLTPYYCLVSGMINFPFASMLFIDRFNDYRKLNFIVVSILIMATIFVIKRASARGLYISKEKICYKSFFTKKTIDASTIVAIKVSKALMGKRFGPLYDLKDKHGAGLYTMFLLNDIDNEMFQYSDGDLLFCNEFQKHVICRCIYDHAAVEHLKSINPNIVCMT